MKKIKDTQLYHRGFVAHAHGFKIILSPDQGGGLSVECPDLPGCFTYGETKDEALANADEAIQLHLQTMEKIKKGI